MARRKLLSGTREAKDISDAEIAEFLRQHGEGSRLPPPPITFKYQGMRRNQRVRILSVPKLGLDPKLVGRCAVITQAPTKRGRNSAWIRLDGPRRTRVFLSQTELELAPDCGRKKS